MSDFLVEEVNGAFGGFFQKIEATDEGALARARRTENADGLVFRDFERDAFQNMELAIFLVQIPKLNGRGHGVLRRFSSQAKNRDKLKVRMR